MNEVPLFSKSQKLAWVGGVIGLFLVVFAGFSQCRQQNSLAREIVRLLESPVVELALFTGSRPDEDRLCYLNRSDPEIGTVVGLLRTAEKTFPSHPSLIETFSLRLTFEDGGQAFFKMVRYEHYPAGAFLDSLYYTARGHEEPALVGTKILQVNELGDWVVDTMLREGCTSLIE